MDTKPVQRMFYLDWLRVLAILSVFVYHSTRFFNLGDWHVKNARLYPAVQVFESFMEIWMMPLIFLISGASIYFAMNKGGFGKFVKDKVLRLLIPLLVAMFTYASLQVYLERITHGRFSGTYFEFLPHYFEGVYLDVGSAGNFAIHGMHMWYVMILFLYSLMFYPLFRWFKAGGDSVLQKLGNILAFPWTMYLALAFPILLMGIGISDTGWEFGAGGWGFLYYIFFLLYGFVIVSNERLQANMRHMRWLSLTLGVILGVTYIFLIANTANPVIEPLEDALGDLIYVLSACCLLPAMLGFGMQHLKSSTRFLQYANEAVLPFYILHQTVLLSMGFFITHWAIPDLLKWVLILASSFAICLGIYEFLVRRVNVLRVLFGMKPTIKPAVPEISEIQPAEASRSM